MLDEAMVDVLTGDVSPEYAGIAYCAVIETCRDVFELDRAHQWTTSLTRWCAQQPELVPYRGQCLVHRAELMVLSGSWTEAMAEVRRARERLSDPPGQPAVGMALYREAELHRLRGGTRSAEARYREAGRCGHALQPGLALLRLAQGQVVPAAAALRTALDESGDPLARARLLPAYVEALLAAGDVAGAHAAAEELAGVAARWSTPLLLAVSDLATGAVLLAEDESRVALRVLRQSWRAWRAIGAPYGAARARVLCGLASRRLGDVETAVRGLGRRSTGVPRTARRPRPRRSGGTGRPGCRGRPWSERTGARGAEVGRSRPQQAAATARSPGTWGSASTRSPGACRTSRQARRLVADGRGGVRLRARTAHPPPASVPTSAAGWRMRPWTSESSRRHRMASSAGRT